MRGLKAIAITSGLLVGCWVISAHIYFDITWAMIWITSLWAGIDSARIRLNEYKTSISTRPIVIVCCCALLWIVAFPCYLWARFKVKDGAAPLKNEILGPAQGFFRRAGQILSTGAEWLVVFVVALKICFLLFCVEEYWRGERVWAATRKQIEAKGDSLDWEALIPPPVPEAKNFFCAPKMAEWFVRPADKAATNELVAKLVFKNATAEIPVADVLVSLQGGRQPEPGETLLKINDPAVRRQASEIIQAQLGRYAIGLQSQEVFLLEAPPKRALARILLEADKSPTPDQIEGLFGYSSTGPLSVKVTGTNVYRISTRICTTSNYLAWSEQLQGTFDLVRTALKRPYARMDGNYSEPPRIPIPHYVAIRSLVQTLGQRAQCHLLLNEPERALEDLNLLNDVCGMVEGAPTGQPVSLVSVMIKVAVKGLYAQVIADGLRLDAWQEPQLKLLQSRLEKIYLAPTVLEALKEEQTSCWRLMQTEVIEKFQVKVEPEASWERKMRNLRPPNLLKGIFLLNAVTAIEQHQKAIESIDLHQLTFRPEKLREFERMHNRRMTPYNVFALIVVPNFTSAIRTSALNQTMLDQAQVACALERYYLKRGTYPERLNELQPDFIGSLPRDVIGGEPLKYRRINADKFILYSVGWNETDEGGRYSSLPDNDGDWPLF